MQLYVNLVTAEVVPES